MRKLNWLAGLALLMQFASCDKVKQGVKENCNDVNTCFSIDSLNAQLKSRLDGHCAGYGYVITVKDKVLTFNSGGKERFSQDPPERAYSVYSRRNPASLAKTITGIALMCALDEKGISVNDSIYKYLPGSWTFGNLTKTITFRELLLHRAGIRSPNGVMDYAFIKKVIKDGVTQADKNTEQYDNTNYGIMRMLIPIIDGQKLTGTDDELATKYGEALRDYVQKHVFDKVNIKDVSCDGGSEIDPALSYRYPLDGKKGTHYGDWIKENGGAAWIVSPLEFAAVMRSAFYTTNIISANTAEQMRDNAWGFDSWVVGNTPFFNVHYVGKTGYLPGPNNGGEFNGAYVMFDNNVSVTLYINSEQEYNGVTQPGNVQQVILDAFDASRTPPAIK